MSASRILRSARHRAGLTQRELAKRTHVPQSTIARIESGYTSPRVETLAKLIRDCGEELEAVPRLGIGIDRSLIRKMLRLAPVERLRVTAAAQNAARKRAAGRPKSRIELDYLRSLRKEIEALEAKKRKRRKKSPRKR